MDWRHENGKENENCQNENCNNDEIVKTATNDTSSEKTMDCAMIPEKQISKHFNKDDRLKKMKNKQ